MTTIRAASFPSKVVASNRGPAAVPARPDESHCRGVSPAASSTRMITTSLAGPMSVPISSSTGAVVNVSTNGTFGSPRVVWHAERRQPFGMSTRYARPAFVYVPGPVVGLGRAVAVAAGDDVAVGVGETVAADCAALGVGLGEGAAENGLHATRQATSTKRPGLRRRATGSFTGQLSLRPRGYVRYFLNHSIVAVHAFCACGALYRSGPFVSL